MRPRAAAAPREGGQDSTWQDGDPSERTPIGPEQLGALARLATAAGAPELAVEATALAERLAEGRFYVACVGQFKRGKSTLLNALIGQSLLPAGVVPITTAVTVLRWGPELRARARLRGEWWPIEPGDLAAYVSEEENPGNRKGVSIVEVFVPSPLLAHGMSLVDTPGIGSVIRANSDATREFVPQIDAALVVLGTDPPISGEELALVEEAAAQVSTLVFALSKADRATEAERAEAAAFARRVLGERLRRDVGPILEVSARERLDGGAATRHWSELERTLERLASTAGRTLVVQAARRGVSRLAGRIRHEIDEQRAALVRPIAESEQRVAGLRACVADATQALQDLGFLLAGEQKRLGERFGEQWTAFVTAAEPAARTELAAALRELRGGREAVRARAFVLAQEIAVRSVRQWLNDTEPVAEALYREAAERFIALANALLQRLATEGGLAALPRSVSPECGFRTARRFFPTTLLHHVTRPPGRWILDALRTPAAARRALEREVYDYLGLLVSANAARVVNDFEERVLESRRRLEAEIRSFLEQLTVSAERALDRARDRQAAGQDAVRADVARLDALRQAVDTLCSNGAAGQPAPAAPGGSAG